MQSFFKSNRNWAFAILGQVPERTWRSLRLLPIMCGRYHTIHFYTRVYPNNFIFCLPLCLLPLIFPCIRVFPNASVLPIRWPKYWRFSFSIGSSNEHSELISFSMDWFYLFAVQGTLKSLVQHHSLKASILWYSAFFMVQLSHMDGGAW